MNRPRNRWMNHPRERLHDRSSLVSFTSWPSRSRRIGGSQWRRVFLGCWASSLHGSDGHCHTGFVASGSTWAPRSGAVPPQHRRCLVTSSSSKSEYVLHVCTSCRAQGSPREPFYQREGYKLFQALKDELGDSELGDVVEVQPAECLSICPRPCGIAISSPGSWSYLFGDQQPTVSVKEIIECLALYVSTSKGFMSRSERPKGLRGSILGRVPPFGGTHALV